MRFDKVVEKAGKYGMAPKVFVKTFGCQMNDRDSEALAGLFLDKGYGLADKPETADVILVNTCSVRGHAEQRALSFLGSLKKPLSKRNRPAAGKKNSNKTRDVHAVVGLIGCMAKNKGEEVFRRMPHVNLVCGPAKLAKVPEYAEKIRKQRARIIDLEDKQRAEKFYKAEFRKESKAGQIVISTGCSNYCSYCVVPFVRGGIRPRKPKSIENEVKRNVKLGITKIVLLGQNVNDYSYSAPGALGGKTSFTGLLKRINKVEGVEEISFITSHPKNTSKELFTLMAKSSKISKHLHLPFQSGSNRILKLMNRGYTREKYLNLALEYKKIVGGELSTDVIVGFPTETEQDFLRTKEVLEKIRFRRAYIFKYSPRPNTQSEKLDDDVPEEVKKRRHKILLDLQKRISLNEE